jgi:CcmD family protein
MRARKPRRSAPFAEWFVAASLFVGSLFVGSLFVGSLFVGSAAAQDANGGAGTGRETEFVAMTGPAQESVPGGALLVSAYAAVFVLLAAYVGRLALLQASTSRELARLEAALRARDADGAKKGAEDAR